jgi:riboflavin kinase / FMN adenylyltransferase
MRVHRNINNLPAFKNAAITIGTFDGVHTGHLQIITQLKKEAQNNNGETVIITFHPHPRMIIQSREKKENNKPSIKLLNTLSEKIELLRKHKIDHLVIVPFTREFSNQTADEYIHDFLVSKFHPKTIIIGYDHRFGRDRKGDYKLMEKYQESFHYNVKEIPEHVLHHVTISSSKIRQALTVGDIKTANEYLGYEYFFEGKIVEGNKLGKTLGYPTANILVNDAFKLIPAYGVYAVTVSMGIESQKPDDIFIAEADYKGMMNIGIRPTIGDNKIMIEVNIFNFDKDIYGRVMRVYVRKYMRPEIKFNDLEELKVQLAMDEFDVKKVLSGD